MDSQEQLFLGNHADLRRQMEFLERTLTLGVTFKNRDVVRQSAWNSPEFVEFGAAPSEGVSRQQLLEEFERIARASTNFSSPNFVGFPDAGNSVAGLAASVLAPFLNQNLINQEFCAPEATFVEMETIHWLRQIVGYSPGRRYNKALDIGGCAVHGGVLANCIAMLAARESLFPGAMKTGLKIDPARVKVIVPAGISHYSIRMSLAWLGLGEAGIVDVPIASTHRLDLIELERAIVREIERGNEIMACVAYAGDSRSMAMDDFPGIARILGKYGIWFHVDACHGVQLLFSHRHREVARGIELADSVTVDPHKVLWVPYVCSFVLFKDQATLRTVSSSSDLITKEKWSLGQVTPFIGSKAFNSLKLWSFIKNCGTRRIGELVDERIDLSIRIRDLIRSTSPLLMLNDSDINSSMFMYIPENLHGRRLGYGVLNVVNEINLRIKDQIKEAGRYYVHGFPIPSASFVGDFPPHATLQVLRIMNGNPSTTLDHIQSMLQKVVSLGKQLCAERMGSLSTDRDIRESVFFTEFSAWLQAFLAGAEHLAIVYGSSIDASDFFKSDIDLMVIAEDAFCSPMNSEILMRKVRDLHQRFALPLDEEIPFERKLLVPMSFARSALCGTGFDLRSNNVVIPDIEKSPEFLGSDRMRARLVVNVMSTRSVLLSGEFDTYYDFKIRAARLVVWLMMKQVEFVSDADALCDLLYGFRGRVGEAFLGYKRSCALDEHLRPLVRYVFSDMLKRQEIVEFRGNYVLGQGFDFKCILALQRALVTDRLDVTEGQPWLKPQLIDDSHCAEAENLGSTMQFGGP